MDRLREDLARLDAWRNWMEIAEGRKEWSARSPGLRKWMTFTVFIVAHLVFYNV